MPKSFDDEYMLDLYKAILTLENEDECKLFFKDLCTYPEVKAMSQRFAVAKMLKNDEKYVDIVKKTGASTATISRVKRSLDYDNTGYDLVLPRMEDKE